MSDRVTDFYRRVATGGEDPWNADPGHVQRCSTAMIDSLRLIPTDAVADVGCGRGVYARRLRDELRPEVPVLCVDPVAEMLERLADSPGLRPLLAGAEDLAEGRVALPDGRPLDAIVLKESVQHLRSPGDTLPGLSRLLSRHGRVLVVMLPPAIEHPLFRAAHERFRELQPEPEQIREILAGAGLRASISWRTFHVAVERETYVRMLESRYMSVLGGFSTDELTAGIEHFRRTYRDPVLRFDDHLAFVRGWV